METGSEGTHRPVCAAGAAILFLLLIPLYFSYAYAVYAWTAEALLFLLPGLQGTPPLELAGWLVGAAAILSLLIAYPMLQLSLPKLAFLPSCAAAYTCVTAASLFPWRSFYTEENQRAVYKACIHTGFCSTCGSMSSLLHNISCPL